MAANNFVLDVQDSASVQAWKDRAQALNERTEQVIKEASQVLDEFKDTAEGNVFEQVCQYSGQVISGLTEVMRGINSILTAVDSMMNLIKQKSAELIEGVAGVVSKVFGG